jgi:opacity protein-like surface antigen
VKPVASFTGGSNFAPIGWVAGGGAEWGLNGPWSITAEYLHANLGKGAGSIASCSGPAAACAGFAGISFQSIHTSATANMFRVGINYWFGYWEP